MPQIPALIGQIGPGWHALLLRIHTDIVRADPAYDVIELGEQDGSLHLRLRSPAGVDVNRVTMTVRRRSQTICELCGEPGQIRIMGSARIRRSSTRCPLCVALHSAPVGHSAWKLVGNGGTPLPAGRHGGYQVIVGTREVAFQFFARLLRLSGKAIVAADTSSATLTTEHCGAREDWHLLTLTE